MKNPFDNIREPDPDFIWERIPSFYCAVYSGSMNRVPCVYQCNECRVEVLRTREKNKKLPPLKNS